MPDIRGKPHTGRAKRTSVKKAESKEQSLKSKLNSTKEAISKAQKSLRKYTKLAKEAKSSTQKQKYERLANTSSKNLKASKKRLDRFESKHKTAKSKSNKLKTQKGDMNAIKDRISEQTNKWTNKGKMALYRTDGVGSAIFSPQLKRKGEGIKRILLPGPGEKGQPVPGIARVPVKPVP